MWKQVLLGALRRIFCSAIWRARTAVHSSSVQFDFAASGDHTSEAVLDFRDEIVYPIDIHLAEPRPEAPSRERIGEALDKFFILRAGETKTFIRSNTLPDNNYVDCSRTDWAQTVQKLASRRCGRIGTR
jgi:hypothetical protein